MDIDKFIKIYIFEKARQDGFANRLNDFNIDAITDKIKSRVIDTICEEVSQLEDWVDFYEYCDSQAQKWTIILILCTLIMAKERENKWEINLKEMTY